MLSAFAFSASLALCAFTTAGLAYDWVGELKGRGLREWASLAAQLAAMGVASALTLVAAISILWNLWRYSR